MLHLYGAADVIKDKCYSHQVMGAMPAAGLAGLLSGGSMAEGMLVDRLEWVRAWTEATAAADPDPQCRELAGACRSLQARCSLSVC